MISPEILCLLMFGTTFILLLSGFPVAFVLSGTGALFAFIGAAMGIFDLSLLTAFPQRIFSAMSNEVLVAVPLFVFMGVMLERSRVAEELLENMARLFGSVPGGLAFSVCIVGALLAASTGIVGATVVTMGLLSLPTMLKRGYSITLATGTIAASGTLGQIIPPSIVLVLLGEQLSNSYQRAQFEMGIFSPDTITANDLFAGALFPGLMLVGMYILYQIIFVIIAPHKAPPIPQDELDNTDKVAFYKSLLSSLFAPLVLILAVLGSILGGLASPTEAAAVGSVGSILLAGYRINPEKGRWILIGGLSVFAMIIISSYADMRLNVEVISLPNKIAIGVCFILSIFMIMGIATGLKRTFGQMDRTNNRVLISVMRTTMEISSMVFIILVGAALFSLAFRGFGGDEYIEHILTDLPGGTIGAILLVMLVMFIMGFFLDFLEIVFIVVPIVAPILLQMEISPGVLMSPVWLGVMMAVNLQTSFLTPPFGFALFYLRGVAPPEVTTMHIYKGVIPFVIIQLFALMLLWYFPGISTWLPTQIYG
ncbi:MAG: TRAP transporter large permease subunit [Rhizobiales bacterium]|nr:TRAP transporter large permease subunit [Hyphomicrobiales bacterium]